MKDPSRFRKMSMHRASEAGDLCAIFVHAGAGYHSAANEKLHLGAVNDAAKIGMAILKNGGDATDAVEMAIRLLEDREITNAGYGSNLTLEGHVECDATLVDHLGRSGAVGAVSQVKNPIALARIVLEASSKPLSLQRVPPNFIVGEGAVNFAADHGISILPHDYLISPNAHARWLAWKQDLLNANQKETANTTNTKTEVHKLIRAEKGPTDHPPKATESNVYGYFPKTANDSGTMPIPQGPLHFDALLQSTDRDSGPAPYHEYARVSGRTNGVLDVHMLADKQRQDIISAIKRPRLDGSVSARELKNNDVEAEQQITHVGDAKDVPLNDMITDTVGCIAIDCFGHIAAGSSSGGIGMKHRGRCGPAALVGIGTAVIPVDPRDHDDTCVATVTSGTGEHMATTSAAATAADRLYLRVKRNGARLQDCDEDEALYSMIKTDFMEHPGVQNQPCAGALGVLAVKKTKDGIYFYFGHNTDSFAIASMHSEERRPVCTMSRNKGDGSIAQGGRVARSRKAKELKINHA